MAISSPAQGVWFPQWAEILAKTRLKDLERRAYYRAIIEYLRFCKASRQRATVASAREFMEQVEGKRRLGTSQLTAWKAGLNWFFRMAGKDGGSNLTSPRPSPLLSGAEREKNAKGNDPPASACVRDKEPPLAETDLGGPEWERKSVV